MGRLRSDVKAVTAIVVGAAAGVAGTVMTLRVLDDGGATARACVQAESSKVVYTMDRKAGSSVVFAPAVPGAATAAACEDGPHHAPVTVIRSHRVETAPVRVQVRVRDLRSKEAELRARTEELRARGEELRVRGEELRARGEELRARGEELRARGSDSGLQEEALRARIEALRTGGADLDVRAREMRDQVEDLRRRMERVRSEAVAAGGGAGG